MKIKKQRERQLNERDTFLFIASNTFIFTYFGRIIRFYLHPTPLLGHIHTLYRHTSLHLNLSDGEISRILKKKRSYVAYLGWRRFCRWHHKGMAADTGTNDESPANV